MNTHFPKGIAYILLIVLLIGGLVLAARPVVADNPVPELLGAELTLDSALTPLDPLAMRVRSASLNRIAVEQARAALAAGQTPAPLGLSLFPDTYLVARFERVERALGGYSLAGKIEGSPYSEIHLSVTEGAFFASLNTVQGLFQISAPDGKNSRVTQFDPARFPQEDEALPASSAVSTPFQADVTVGPSTVDDGTRIDVYVGYTTAAQTAAGGPAALLSRINTAISETNTGYANSGVLQRVALAGADEYAYDETGFNWGTTLTRWTDPADAVFGPAHTLRETNKADEMVLLVSNTSYCGLGYLMTSPGVGFASSAFALVAQSCATGYYSFAHEMGHNMGAHHDRYTVSAGGGGQGAYPYAYGFWINNPATGRYDWRTIMAYNVPAGSGYNATRINYWSNPNIKYNDQPVGVDVPDSANSAYNALVLNNTAPFVAQFRDGAAPPAPTGLGVSVPVANSAKLDWAFSGSDVWNFRIERASLAVEDWAQIASVPAGQLTYTDATYVSGINLRYRVLADNGNGRSASNIALTSLAPSTLTVAPTGPYSAKLDWLNASPAANTLVVQRAPAGSTAWATIATPAVTAVTYTDAAVPDGQSYQYQVVATFSSTPFTSNVATLIALPAAPATLTATGLGGSTVKLDWTLAPGTLTGLSIDRQALNGTFSTLGTIAGNLLTFTDATLPASGDFQYRVVARNARGDTPSATITLPAAPANLHPVYPAAANALNLAWTDASAVETGFVLEVSTTGGASWAAVATPAANAQAYSYSPGCGLAPQYRLRAVAAGSQSAAITTSAVTRPCPPALVVITTSHRAVLSWQSGGAGVTYNVYSLKNSSLFLLTTPPLPALTTLYVVSDLVPTSSYRFQIEALNAAGATLSPEVSVTTKARDYFLPSIRR